MRASRFYRGRGSRLGITVAVAVCGAVGCSGSASAPEAKVSLSNISPTSTGNAQTAIFAGPCILRPNEISTAISSIVHVGDVIPKSDSNVCDYSLNSSDDQYAGFQITAHPYSANSLTVIGVGIHGSERRFGGSTPQEVFSSASNAFREVAAIEGNTGFATIPDAGAGIVSDETSSVVVAGNHGQWYMAGFSGEIVTDGASKQSQYAPALLELGRAIAAAG